MGATSEVDDDESAGTGGDGIPTRPRRFLFVTERKAVITVTVVAKLVIN